MAGQILIDGFAPQQDFALIIHPNHPLLSLVALRAPRIEIPNRWREIMYSGLPWRSLRLVEDPVFSGERSGGLGVG